MIIVSATLAVASIYGQQSQGYGIPASPGQQAQKNTGTNATSTPSKTIITNSSNVNSGSTSTAADVAKLLNMVICNLGTATANPSTTTAAVNENGTHPVISMSLLTSASPNPASTTSRSNATTSTSSVNSANSTLGNATTHNTQKEKSILAINGHAFTPGQVVLVFSDKGLLAIDNVKNNGVIGAKVIVTNPASMNVSVVESGTMKKADFTFSGQTLTTSNSKGSISASNANNAKNTASNETSTAASNITQGTTTCIKLGGATTASSTSSGSATTTSSTVNSTTSTASQPTTTSSANNTNTNATNENMTTFEQCAANPNMCESSSGANISSSATASTNTTTATTAGAWSTFTANGRIASLIFNTTPSSTATASTSTNNTSSTSNVTSSANSTMVANTTSASKTNSSKSSAATDATNAFETASSNATSNAKTSTAAGPTLPYILAGNWSMSVNNGNVSSFKASFVMVHTDGKGRHTHDLVNFKPDNATSEATTLQSNGTTVFSGTLDFMASSATKWTGVHAAIAIEKLNAISIVLSSTATENHFKGQAIYGVVDSVQYNGKEMLRQ